MTANQLNEAITMIDDRYLDMVDLQEKEMISMSNTRNTGSIRKRVLTALIAAAILLFVMSATAFALSEDFRVAVLSFFRIEVEDKVEQIPAEDIPLRPENDPVQSGEDGQAGQNELPGVSVSRVRVLDNGFASGGLFYVCSDGIEYNSGSRYDVFDMKNGELVALKKNDYRVDCQINGKNYPIHLEWAENGASIGIGYVDGPKMTDGSSTEGTYTVCQTLYNNGPKALLLIEAGGTIRPVIADLTENTAKLIDLDADLSQAGSICDAELSANGTTLLLQTTALDVKFYGIEVATGKTVCLNDLCGHEIYGCRFVSDTQLICWTIMGGMDEETVEKKIAGQAAGQSGAEYGDCGTITAWKVSPATGELKTVLSDKNAEACVNPIMSALGRQEKTGEDDAGIICMTGRYAVEKQSDGSIIIYDLVEERQIIPYGVLFPKADSLDVIASPNGTKVLFVERDGGNGALTQISVLDMSGSRFVTIDRDPSAVGNEHRADWFDNDTVLVDNNTYDDSGNSTCESWIYLYDVE